MFLPPARYVVQIMLPIKVISFPYPCIKILKILLTIAVATLQILQK